MRCEEFIQEWSTYRDGCDVELSAEAAEHGATCPRCRAEMMLADDLERALRLGLAQRASAALPRASAVAQAVLAATAALDEQPARQAPRTIARSWRTESLHIVPPSPKLGLLGGSVARWAVAAVFIIAAGLLGRGQPLNPTPTYADMTATVIAMPSPTPSASVTVSAHVPVTPAVVSYARVAATPGPAN